MQLQTTVAGLRAALADLPRPLGFVPTMGYLHQGHLSLVRAAAAENASTVVSIFVNPTQFGEAQDFALYPRDPERDCGLLADAGVDVTFAPDEGEMYPSGFDTYVVVGGVSEGLEGAARPGHFRGVATVVAKLLNVVQPDRAYFGQKDAQQLAVIRKLVADLAMPVEIRAVPTQREPDGLAMSSRNVRLSPSERAAATVLSRALRAAEASYRQGERSAERLRQVMRQELAAEPLARPDYVSVADAGSLRELDDVHGPALLSLAVRIGPVRLIDNIALR